jgi:hypothetical protein
VWDAQSGWLTFDPTPAVGEVPFYRRGVIAEVDSRAHLDAVWP